MKRSKAYRGRSVKDVCVERLVSGWEGTQATVGIDVGKESLLVVVRWASGEFERPWRVQNPWEVSELVELLAELSKRVSLSIGMESSGVYGDPLRQSLADRGLCVVRVSGKHTHDYAEVFDGVPSQHDGKDAAIIAELVWLGKAQRWSDASASEADQLLAYWVDWLDVQESLVRQWEGRLEALLSRHWPELGRWLELKRATLVNLLAHYGGPAWLAQDAEARDRLAKWGGGLLKEPKIAGVLASAASTCGVRQTVVDRQRMQTYAGELHKARRERDRARRELEKLSAEDEEIERQAEVVGRATACVLRAELGPASNYANGASYRKAMGLNLKERSSGKHQGQLKLTKRGPSKVRRWLYFAALRAVQSDPVKEWHEKKKKRDGNRGGKSIVAVMRKLALALYRVGVGGDRYDPKLLFPGRPLTVGNSVR